MKLRKGDKVAVLAGRDRGKQGEVLRVLPSQAQVLVEGVNVVKRHTKPSNANPRGGIVDLTKPLPAGKLGVVCPHCKQITRVGYRQSGQTKERICRKCQGALK